MDYELPEVLATAPGRVRAAELLVDGLSVFCFNKTGAEPFWEVALPRQDHHNLTITIQELDADGHNVGMPMTYPVHREIETFTIRLTNGSLEHYEPGHFPNGGPAAEDFDRNAPDNDPHDLGWLVYLDGDEIGHGEFLGFKPRHPNRLRSVASIRHSLFCNLEPDEFPSVISPLRHNEPGSADSYVLGQTNTMIVGVLLATDAGNILFEFHPGDLTTIGPRPYDENRRYRIEIINEDTHMPHEHEDFRRGDLRLFYDELINVSGELKDLWAIPAPRFSPDGDCHPTRFSGETFEPGVLREA